MPRIRIVPGGPMFVEDLTIGRLAHDGDAWRIERVPTPGRDRGICRCGGSSTMPWCDGEPPFACFVEEEPTGPAPEPFRWDVPDPARPGVALKPNGPVRVSGGVPVVYGEDPIPSRDRVSLCRCGASRCQPICDSSHKIVGYRD